MLLEYGFRKDTLVTLTEIEAVFVEAREMRRRLSRRRFTHPYPV